MPATATKSAWVSGNLQFQDKSGNEIITIDGTNRKVSMPAAAEFTVGAVNIIDELQALSGLDSGELGVLNGVTPGTAIASKVVTTDASKNVTGLNNLTFDSGAVLSFNAGDVTLTHAANSLTIAGGVTTFADSVSMASQSPTSHFISFEGATLASNCNAIRGASVNPTRTSGWISFSGTVSATPAQVYTDFRQLTTTGVAEVLGIGTFPTMATGASCKSAFGVQSICQVDSGATVTSAAGAQGTGIYPIYGKTLIDGATVNSGAQIAAAWLSVQANVTDISGRASAILHMEVASGALRDLIYVNATGGVLSTYFLNLSAATSPALSWGADNQPNAAAADLGLRCLVGATEYWIPLYVNT